MRKALLALTSLLLLLPLAAPPAAADPEEDAGKKLKIGLCMANLDPFLSSLADAAVQHAIESGVELILLDAMDDALLQIEQVRAMLDESVDVLVVNPTVIGHTRQIAEFAERAGIPVVWVNRNPFPGLPPPPRNYVIISDSIQEGRLGMEFAGEALGGKGNIVILQGTPGHPAAADRTEGVLKVIERYPDITVLANETASWSRERAAEVMRRLVSVHGDAIDAVIANNDEMALGAIHVLRASGMDDVIVCGVDGTRDGVNSVASGKGIVATAYQDPFAQGAGGIDLAIKAAKGEKMDALTMLKGRLITRANVKEFKRWLQTR